MVILATDVRTVGMNLLELNGLDIAMVGGVDLQLWEVVHRILGFHTVHLMEITSIII
jgi:hypothetical protein